MNRLPPSIDAWRARVGAARPWLVAILLASLVGAQLVAMGTQFEDGFRPFVQPAARVPLSWDMFAQPIERCEVRWTPPLRVHDRDVHAMPELGPQLEWDAVLDHHEDYEQLGVAACSRFGQPGTTVELTCFLAEGRTLHREVPCS